MKLSGAILKSLGWKFKGEFPKLDKSVTIFAPHTSAWDFILGILYFNEHGIKNNTLVKKEMFFFPMNLIMKGLGAISVDRKNRNNNVVSQVASYFHQNEKFNLVVSAEGTRRNIRHWKRGFYYIAQEADVPIVISYIDYKKKEIGIHGIVRDTSDIKKTMIEINEIYRNVKGRHPENFSLDNRFN